MGKNSPSAPPAPDPYATARAQTNSNVNTAVANSILGNANVYGPTGSTVYRQIGTTRVGGPAGSGASSGMTAGNAGGLTRAGYDTGAKGGAGGFGEMGGEGFDVPQWEQINTLSPEQQVLYDQQVKLGQGLNTLAQGQVDRLTDHLGRPMDGKNIPGLKYDFNSGGPIQTSIGPNDFSADRQRVEAAIMSRAMPELDRQRSALESRLANQGLTLGSQAYATGVDESNRARNDAIMSAILAGGQEQSRMFGMDLQKGQFANSAQNQQFNQNQSRAAFGNSASNDAFQREIALRNQPISEITQLMGQGQAQMPNFGSYQGGQVAGTPVGQYVYDSNAINQAQFNNEQQRNTATTNAMMGGLFGLGSAAMMGPAAGLFGIGRSAGGMGLGAGTGRLY